MLSAIALWFCLPLKTCKQTERKKSNIFTVTPYLTDHNQQRFVFSKFYHQTKADLCHKYNNTVEGFIILIKTC